MLIIVEGPDGAGKSTLVAQLVQQLEVEEPGTKIEVLHKGPPTIHPLDEYETPLFGYRPGNGHHIICDRWHVGEWTYPSVLGRRTNATRAMWFHIEMFLHSRGALVVYPTLPLEQLIDRVLNRGDDLIMVHQLAQIDGAYRHMMTQHLLPIWHRGADDPSAIIALARHRDRMSQRLNDFTTYVGPPRPTWLIVGDVRNQTYDGDPRPAFMPYRSTSGSYLLTALRKHQFEGLGIINGCDVDDALMAQYFTFEDVPTVTLGDTAYGKMNGTGICHNGVPHPQYVQRFHNRHGDAYADAIQRARQGEDMITWRPSSGM